MVTFLGYFIKNIPQQIKQKLKRLYCEFDTYKTENSTLT